MGDKKALIVIGSRQCGKTTVLVKLFSSCNDVLWMSGDEPDERMMLQNVTSTELKTTVGSNKILVIDEAQRIENIGLTIKLFTDKIKNVKVIATGSSSFELSDKINEPLTGRSMLLSSNEAKINWLRFLMFLSKHTLGTNTWLSVKPITRILSCKSG